MEILPLVHRSYCTLTAPPKKGGSLRRSRGEGSIYRRKDGLWVARYEVAGRRKYLYGKTRKAVSDKLRERLSWGR